MYLHTILSLQLQKPPIPHHSYYVQSTLPSLMLPYLVYVLPKQPQVIAQSFIPQSCTYPSSQSPSPSPSPAHARQSDPQSNTPPVFPMLVLCCTECSVLLYGMWLRVRADGRTDGRIAGRNAMQDVNAHAAGWRRQVGTVCMYVLDQSNSTLMKDTEQEDTE